MARFVLVHGAFSGASVWNPVLPELAARGHEVEAFDLPGSGEDPTPLAEVTLERYAERVCRQLGRGRPAVLVGHSMGGVAITQAAAACPAAVASLVYVCAFLPQNGQSLVELTHLPESEGDQVQANMVVEGDPPVATLPKLAARSALLECAEEAQVEWALGTLRPQALLPFTEAVSVGGDEFEALPRAYVTCSRDRAVMPALQRRMLEAARCDPVIALDCDHMPMASRLGDLVDALDRLAERS